MFSNNLNIDSIRKLMLHVSAKVNALLLKISGQSLRVKIIYLNLVLFSTIILSYGIALRPLHNKLSGITAQQVMLQTQIIQTQQRLRELGTILRQFATANEGRGKESYEKKSGKRKTNKKAPIIIALLTEQKVDFAALLKNIADAAYINQLTIVAIQPLKIASAEEDLLSQNEEKNTPQKMHSLPTENQSAPDITKNIAQEINFSAYGNYRQIMNFFAAVQRLKWLTAIPVFTLQNAVDASSDKLLLSAVIRVYSIALHGNYWGGMVRAISGERDPFVPSADGAVAGLTAWESRDLHLLGVMQQGKDVVGVVSDVAGQSHSVRVGDVIGVDSAKVIKITNDAIITSIEGENVYR